MENFIDKLLDRVMAPTKNWDFAVIQRHNAPTLEIVPTMKVERVPGEDGWVHVEGFAGHPQPLVEADTKRIFVMSAFFHTSSITAIDFLVERKIRPAGGIVTSLVS